MTVTLRITYDSPRLPEITTVDAGLRWRDWSPREKSAIDAVASGKLRRFSTSRDGVGCDLEQAA